MSDCTFKVKFYEESPMDVKFKSLQVAGAKKGTVRYDTEQELTEEEQRQARSNIGALRKGIIENFYYLDGTVGGAFHPNNFEGWNMAFIIGQSFIGTPPLLVLKGNRDRWYMAFTIFDAKGDVYKGTVDMRDMSYGASKVSLDKITSWGDAVTDTQVATAKLVYDTIKNSSSSVLRITPKQTIDDSGNETWSVDKTPEEIWNALNNGTAVIEWGGRVYSLSWKTSYLDGSFFAAFTSYDIFNISEFGRFSIKYSKTSNTFRVNVEYNDSVSAPNSAIFYCAENLDGELESELATVNAYALYTQINEYVWNGGDGYVSIAANIDVLNEYGEFVSSNILTNCNMETDGENFVAKFDDTKNAVRYTFTGNVYADLDGEWTSPTVTKTKITETHADWNQNDSTASDYIKNRFGGYDSEEKITVNLDAWGRYVVEDGNIEVVTENTIDLTIDGLNGVYEVKEANEGGYYIGDPLEAEEITFGFCLLVYPDYGVIVMNNTEEEHEYKFNCVVPQKIPKRYIPSEAFEIEFSNSPYAGKELSDEEFADLKKLRITVQKSNTGYTTDAIACSPHGDLYLTREYIEKNELPAVEFDSTLSEQNIEISKDKFVYGNYIVLQLNDNATKHRTNVVFPPINVAGYPTHPYDDMQTVAYINNKLFAITVSEAVRNGEKNNTTINIKSIL